MRFRDIPQMPRAHYTANVGWTFLQKWLDDLHDTENNPPKYTLDMNPEFQRDYVWTVDQKVNYVEYILRGGESGRHIYFNHPHWDGDMYGRAVIVDGKQRISAILDFLNGKVRAFGYCYHEFEDELRMAGPDFIVGVGCLKTDKDVYEWYLSMNTGGTYHTKEEIEKVEKLISGLNE